MSRILVAMSGGVDSSVAAKILHDQGHEIAGVTLRLMADPEPVDGITPDCPALTAIADARAVADKLGIPHLVCDMRDLFEEKVISKFVSVYRAGETPNPCVDCNKTIKFGALVDFALEQGYDYVATGHYAQIVTDSVSGRYLLKRGTDPAKDQSYVLYGLTQHQLAHSLFPLGTMDKSTIRTIALEAGFVTAHKADSQDICFVPDGNYAGFIEKRHPEAAQSGNFIDKTGAVIGTHRGIIRYTIGQRRGIATAFGKPMYVTDKDAKTNTVTLGENPDLMRSSIIIHDINLISIESLDSPLSVTAKIRYNQREQPARISLQTDGNILVEFDEPQRAVAAGQACVFYSGDTVVGGGTI